MAKSHPRARCTATIDGAFIASDSWLGCYNCKMLIVIYLLFACWTCYESVCHPLNIGWYFIRCWMKGMISSMFFQSLSRDFTTWRFSENIDSMLNVLVVNKNELSCAMENFRCHYKICTIVLTLKSHIRQSELGALLAYTSTGNWSQEGSCMWSTVVSLSPAVAAASTLSSNAIYIWTTHLIVTYFFFQRWLSRSRCNGEVFPGFHFRWNIPQFQMVSPPRIHDESSCNFTWWCSPLITSMKLTASDYAISQMTVFE